MSKSKKAAYSTAKSASTTERKALSPLNGSEFPQSASLFASFDTLQLLDDLAIPGGNWGSSSTPEPITSTVTEFGGTGGATQAITSTTIQNFILHQFLP